jgi:septum formation protein
MSKNNPESKPALILASASPRRKELLEKEGYNFTVSVSNVNEQDLLKETMSPSDFAQTAALAKASDVSAEYPDALVIGADTVVDFNGQIIGKPKNKRHAEEITRKLFSQPHKVITGIALVRKCDNFQVVKSDMTVVYPKRMNPEQIEKHLKSRQWQGKAGAYAIQENDEFIDHIEGSFTNVVGLPMQLLNQISHLKG